MSWVAAGVGVGTAVYGLVKSSKQAKAAKNAERNLKNPFYAIQSEYEQNKNLAAEQAGQGLASGTKDFLTTERERGLGSSLQSESQGGGGPNDIARLFDTYNRSTAAEGSEDAQVHQKNIEYYMNANSELAAQKTIQWGVNEKQPYESKLKELTERRAAAEQSENNSINSLGTAAIGGITGNQNSWMKKLFQTNNADNQDPFQFTRGRKSAVTGSLADAGVGGVTSPAGSVSSIDGSTPLNQAGLPDDETSENE